MATSKIQNLYPFSSTTLLANMAHTTGLDEQSLSDSLSYYGLICIIVGNSNGAIHASITIPVDEFMNHSSNSNLIRLEGDSSDRYALIKAKSGDYSKIYIQTNDTAYVKVLGIR